MSDDQNLGRNDRPEEPGTGRERISPQLFQSDPSAPQHVDLLGDGGLSVEKEIDLDAKVYSQGQLVRRRFVRHRGGMAALVVFVFVVLLAVTSIGWGPIPGWWDKNYVSNYDLQNGGRPTLSLWPFSIGEHPFGQDSVGRDYFAYVMRGVQQSLVVAFVVGTVSTVIGTAIGAAAGYYRGWIESMLMRVTDLFIVIPLLVLAAVLGQISGGGIWFLSLILGIVTWTGLARLVRGEVLSLREREFVTAARAGGTSNPRIILRHILPNCFGVIIVNLTLALAAAILLESSLSFLGYGIQPPDTSLGLLISDNQGALNSRPWLFYWPGVFIIAIALAVNFIGDGLRDAFDPRANRSKD